MSSKRAGVTTHLAAIHLGVTKERFESARQKRRRLKRIEEKQIKIKEQ